MSTASAKVRAQASRFGEMTLFFGEVVRGVVSRRALAYSGECVRQGFALVRGSLIVILGMVFALGLAVGVQSAYTARTIGSPAVGGAASAIADLREIMPYAFGYMMSAKVSTGYVAELGTMRISDEIDALDVLGMDSKVYLCTTRLLGAWLVLPFVFAIALITSFIGSYLAVVIQIADVSSGGFFELFWKFQIPADFLFAFLKAMAMATFVVLVGCFYGFTVRGGPVDVGRATAKAMVVNLIGVHVIGVVGSQLAWGGQSLLPIGG